jgi:2-polyprenyl-3-methyl-5-hydroxy-6-metoxy-1,4-benzoquinol methylase
VTTILQNYSFANRDSESNSSRLGFHIVLCLEVMKWILEHYDALQSVEPEKLTDEVKDQLKPKGRAFKRQLESIPFPEKVKDMMRALTSNGNQTTALHPRISLKKRSSQSTPKRMCIGSSFGCNEGRRPNLSGRDCVILR